MPRLLTVLFTATMFASASLMFVVEPMLGRLVVPLFGGSAEVWNACLLFFQLTLLLGYVYAHAVPKRLGMVPHAAIHLALIGLSLLTLPIVLRIAWAPPDATHPLQSLLTLLLVSAGAPFLLLASTAPLLQSWFAGTSHPLRRDPYFLYAASNLGSLGALLAYPFLIEPAATLTRQRTVWAALYVVFAVLIGACALLAIRARSRGAVAEEPGDAAPDSGTPANVVTNRLRVRWLLLALVPSSLMLGVTSYLTTDIAPVPLLWVLPLALYLLTFVLVFARRPPIPHSWMLHAQAAVLGLAVPLMIWAVETSATRLLWLHLSVFAVTAMVCHGELARSRPRAEHVTEFYLWLSLGGALGGVFNVLVAPMIFHTLLEYPIVLVLACALRPAGARGEGGGRVALAFAALAILIVLLVKGVEADAIRIPFEISQLRFGILFSSILFFFVWLPLRRRPWAMAAAAAIVLGSAAVFESMRGDIVLSVRNFYGTRTVVQTSTRHALYHGTTEHGAQSLDPAERREPGSYYARSGPLGDLMRELPLPAGPRRVAAIGLGAGVAATYIRPGDNWTYFELDPDIEKIARDPRCFTYLADAPMPVRVVLGDGRLTLGPEPDGTFDLILVDAFNSDAIPVHLLTREAIDLYRRKLVPGGAIAFHLSNRHLDLKRVVGRLVEDMGLEGRIRHVRGAEIEEGSREDRSTWAVVAESPAALGGLLADHRWVPARGDPDVAAWTDDYSNIFKIFRW